MLRLQGHHLYALPANPIPDPLPSGPAGPKVLTEPIQRVSHLLVVVLKHLHCLLLTAPVHVCYTPNLLDNLKPERVLLQLCLPARPPAAAPSAVKRADGRLAIQADRPLAPERLNRLHRATHPVARRLQQVQRLLYSSRCRCRCQRVVGGAVCWWTRCKARCKAGARWGAGHGSCCSQCSRCSRCSSWCPCPYPKRAAERLGQPLQQLHTLHVVLMQQLLLLRDVTYGGLKVIVPCLTARINRPQVVSELWHRLREQG